MSETESPTSDPTAPPRRSRAATAVLVLLVLALATATGLLAREASASRQDARKLRSLVDEQQAAAASRSAAIDAALSPLALDHVNAAQSLLKKGDKAAAKARLKEAQTVAVWLRDMGSGRPSGELVAALTEVERALDQPPTLLPTPMGGG